MIGALAAGDLTPSEAREIATILEGQRRAIEIEDIDHHLTALEQRAETRSPR